MTIEDALQVMETAHPGTVAKVWFVTRPSMRWYATIEGTAGKSGHQDRSLPVAVGSVIFEYQVELEPDPTYRNPPEYHP